MDLKTQAAARALAYVKSGMVLGLGSGSTASRFVQLLGERLALGTLKSIVGVPTSEKTAAQARSLGIPLTTLTDHMKLDLVVDGADEVDPDLNLIKGLGRALLREKIVVTHTERFVVIVDESKLVTCLGTRGPLPVEIVQFEAATHVRWLKTTGCRAELWLEDNGAPIVTDNGNNLVRCWFPDGIADAPALARKLADRPGIVEHGLFLGIASDVIVASSCGLQVLERTK